MLPADVYFTAVRNGILKLANNLLLFSLAVQFFFRLKDFFADDDAATEFAPHSDHRFPAPSSKLCQI